MLSLTNKLHPILKNNQTPPTPKQNIAMASNFCIKIRQETNHCLEKLCSWIPYHLFSIDLEFRYLSPLDPDTTLEAFHRLLICPRDMFLSEELGPSILLSMFANTGASLHFLQTIIHDISSFAWEIDAHPVNLGRKLIKLVVEVQVQESTDDDQVIIDDDSVISSSASAFNFKPASNSSIQALKRVKLSDEGHLLPFKKRRRIEGLSTSTSKKQCTICLDDFSDGGEVVSMPCGHVYHDVCIIRWLETSHLCPLCRYQMPS